MLVGAVGGALLVLSALLYIGSSDPAPVDTQKDSSRRSTRKTVKVDSTQSSTSKSRRENSAGNTKRRSKNRVSLEESPLLKIEDSRGLALEARVTTLKGMILAQGRSPLSIDARTGDLVRVESEGYVAEILPLRAGEQSVQLLPGRSYTGSVVAAESGQALANVRVEAFTALATTDNNGRFELTIPSDGSPELRVTAPNRPSISWTGPEPASIEVPRGVGVRGRVRRADGRSPGRVDILLIGERQLGRSFRVQSQSNGQFQLESGFFPDEKVAVFAWSASGWITAREPRWQVPTNLNALLQAPASLIVEGPGRLEPAHTWPGEPSLVIGNEVGGMRHFSGLAPGVYQLTLNEQVIEKKLSAGGNASLRLQVKEPMETVPVQVSVIDENGLAVTNAIVRVRGLSGREGSAQVDASGVAKIKIPVEDTQGPLTVSGWAPGRTGLPQVFQNTASMEIVLPSSVALVIKVQPSAELDVAIFQDEIELARGRSDSTGEVQFADLPAGEVTVVIETLQGIELRQVVRLPLNGTLQVDVSRQD